MLVLEVPVGLVLGGCTLLGVVFRVVLVVLLGVVLSVVVLMVLLVVLLMVLLVVIVLILDFYQASRAEGTPSSTKAGSKKSMFGQFT